MRPPGSAAASAGELVGDELVGQGVRLGGHAHGDVVPPGEERLGEQVGNGLAHARARLDGAMRRGGEGFGHLACHAHLLGPALEALVHARHDATLGKPVLHLGGGGRAQMREVLGVRAGARGSLAHELLAMLLE